MKRLYAYAYDDDGEIEAHVRLDDEGGLTLYDEAQSEIDRLRSELAAEREVSDARQKEVEREIALHARVRQLSIAVEADLLAELRILRLSDDDRAALATASSELRERRNNWTATYSRVALEQQDNAVTDSYRRTIAEVTAAIEVVDRLRGAK